jgi:Carboxypeptidase regulatory-like domain
MKRNLHFVCVIVLLAIPSFLNASEYHGQVTFNGFPVPGATVTATHGTKSFATVTNQLGVYRFPDLADEIWTIEVEMTGFAIIKKDVAISPNLLVAEWELKLLSLAQIKARIQSEVATAKPALPQASQKRPEAKQPPPKREAKSAEETNPFASPGLLINGSVNNGATSPFAQAPSFGNHHPGMNGLYHAGLGMILDNSAFDASPFSISGHCTPKPSYNQITGILTFGGPIRIPHLLKNGPNFFLGYERTRSVNAITQSALVPTAAERAGNFSQALNPQGQLARIFDPSTGLAFAGNLIPQGGISPQAQALLKLYPLPNFTGNGQYNYQAPINTDTHRDALQTHFEQPLGPRKMLFGGFGFASTREASPNLFGFLDTTGTLGIDSEVHWWHRLSQGLFLKLGYHYTRLSTRVTPFFENLRNVSGEAGIAGNNQDPTNWGPPTLAFATGIAGLSDAQSSFNRNQTSSVSYDVMWLRGRHDITFGGDFRREEFNDLFQQNPRGTFTFTGAATQGSNSGGFDLADFMLGIPDASSIAFGNADKYFRESAYAAYISDDFRVGPGLTIDAGMRWEYGAPMTELYDRLVNLDIVPGFSAVAPVVANASGGPVGPLTGEHYPTSLIRPDWQGFEPRIGIAWRPIAGSSLVVRAGYGIYDNTSVYRTMALQMAQQAPLSKSLSIQNSAACPSTLANGFSACPSTTQDNFAVDPNFRVGYTQNWDAVIQRDLPFSLQLTATYLGTKGTRGVQEFLPNTYPPGAASSCPACPVGFAYFTSNGNSTRQAGEIRLRRRLDAGFTATLDYTYAKAIDEDSLLGGQGANTSQSATVLPWLMTGTARSGGTSQGSPTVAQNWRNLTAERSLSSFDQRNLLTLQLQYTTGMGLTGGSLLSGWKSILLKGWSFLTMITVGSGFPETPVYLAPVPGTGVTGSIRPEYTGAPLYSPPAGLHLNPAAYTAPLSGEWGSAGRNSVIGPGEFSLNASVGRTFRIHGKYHLDLRVDSSNALNHVTYTGWNTTINSSQFGLPVAANAMRSLQTTLRLRF